jgi:hypothetical protein
MADQNLTDYIKTTLAAGFPESHVKQALRDAGWQENDIAEALLEAGGPAKSQIEKNKSENFSQNPDTRKPGQLLLVLSKHKRLVIAGMIVVVGLPILAFAGLSLYQKLTRPKIAPPASPQSFEVSDPPTEIDSNDLNQFASDRDKTRLDDIEKLQTALAAYLVAKEFYPRNLTELVSENLLTSVPRDPILNEPYLYTPLGDPALHYAVSFLLEAGIGQLRAGLQVVSSEKPLPAQNIREQDSLIKGEITPQISQGLAITDLSQTTFYPQEEVSILVEPQTPHVTSAMLVLGNLKLTDQTTPFRFKFTAPKISGQYEIKIFVFDKAGNNFFQSTILTVK